MSWWNLSQSTHVFRGKRSVWESRKWSSIDMLQPIAQCDAVGSSAISLNFFAYSLSKSFCSRFPMPAILFLLYHSVLQPFSNACHTVLAVPFSFAAVFQCLPYCSCCTIQFCPKANCCWSCAPTQMLSFKLASPVLGNFCPKSANNSLYLSIACQSPWTRAAADSRAPKLYLEFRPYSQNAVHDSSLVCHFRTTPPPM